MLTAPSPHPLERLPMPIDWSPFVELVRRHQRFLLTTHVRPDPDGLGSMLGLADALKSMGKHVEMRIASLWPPRYDFLDPQRQIRQLDANDAVVLRPTEM